MANSVSEWSSTASSNTSLGAQTIAENQMLPSGVNNAFRELMAQVATGITAGNFIPDGDKGDVTVSSSGATWTIDAGVVTYDKLATAAIMASGDFRASTASKLLSSAGVWGDAAEVTLTDAATIAVDGNTFINAVVTLGGNRTLGTWQNAKPGQSGRIRVVQDATGSRTLSYHADYEFAGGTAIVLSTAANAEDVLYYDVIASGRVLLSAVKAIS